MVSYRCEVVTYGRSDGKGIAMAAYRAAEKLHELTPHALAAYRAGVRITDNKNKATHDFRRRQGVGETFILLPPEAPPCYGKREVLWSFADQAEGVRKNARVAREVLVSLPHELSTEGRSKAVHELAEHLVQRYRVAVDVAIHLPPTKGDERHHHAHLLCSTRRLGPKGFEGKTRELDQPKTSRVEVEYIRATVAGIVNGALAREGIAAQVDHRSGRRQLAAVRAQAKVKHERLPAVSSLYLQAHLAWAKLDQRRRFAEDPEGMDRLTKLELADRARVLRQAAIDDQVQVYEARIGRRASLRERREIGKAVDRHRHTMAQRGAKLRFVTDAQRRRLTAQRQIRDVQAKLLEPLPTDSPEVLADKLERMRVVAQELLEKGKPAAVLDKLAALAAKITGRGGQSATASSTGRSM